MLATTTSRSIAARSVDIACPSTCRKTGFEVPLPYRTLLQLPPDTDLIALAEQEVQHWLERRGKVEGSRRVGFLTGEFWQPGIHDLGGTRTLSVARTEAQIRATKDVALTECRASGELTLARFRDLVGTGRRDAQLLLERFDRDGLTRRVGDARVLRRAADQPLNTPSA